MTKPTRSPPELRLVVRAKLNPRDLGKMLRAIRAAANVTQGELARMLGVPYQNIGRLEKGEREGMISTINKYVRALGWELVIIARPRRARPVRDDARDGDDAGED